MKGLGVMINELSSNKESSELIQSSVGKKINEVTFDGDSINFEMEGGLKFRIFDDGQSCCESRYMKCDDDLKPFAGADLLGFDLSETEAPTKYDDWGVHEVAFLRVRTSKGEFTVNTHNEHNGYYGGFYLKAEVEKS